MEAGWIGAGGYDRKPLMRWMTTFNGLIAAMACLAAFFSAGCSTSGSIGKMQDLSIPDVQGQMVQPLAAMSDHAATVLVFVTDDCPITNAFAPEISSIVADYEPRGVA